MAAWAAGAWLASRPQLRCSADGELAAGCAAGCAGCSDDGYEEPPSGGARRLCGPAQRVRDLLQADSLQAEFDRVDCPQQAFAHPEGKPSSALALSFTMSFEFQGGAFLAGHPLAGRGCILELLAEAFVCARKAQGLVGLMGGSPTEVEEAYNLYVDDFLALVLHQGCLLPGSLAVPLLRNLTGTTARGRQCVANGCLFGGQPGCQQDIAAHDMEFERLATEVSAGEALAGAPEGGGRPPGPRVSCLLLVRLPNEEEALRRLAGTVLQQCAWAKAFVASEGSAAAGAVLARGIPGIGLVNLKAWQEAAGHALEPDKEHAGSWRGAPLGAKSEVLEGNTIQKALYALLSVGIFLIEEADVFCKFDVDTLFLVENLQAYLRVHSIAPEAVFYFGKEQSFWRYSGVGDFPDGGAGPLRSCTASAAARRAGWTRVAEVHWRYSRHLPHAGSAALVGRPPCGLRREAAQPHARRRGTGARAGQANWRRPDPVVRVGLGHVRLPPGPL